MDEIPNSAPSPSGFIECFVPQRTLVVNFVAPDEIEAASFAAPETVMQTHDPDDGGWRTWLAGRPMFLEPVQVHLAGAWRSATLLNWGVALGIDRTGTGGIMRLIIPVLGLGDGGTVVPGHSVRVRRLP